MNPLHPHPAPDRTSHDKEEPEMSQEDDIPADDKKAEGDKWACGENADHGEEQ